jgi:hypothetical protein
VKIMQRYWMAAHVQACATPAGVILLDLKRDRYLGLGLSESVSLGRHVQDWPVIRSETVLQGTPCEELCATLLADGILSRERPASTTLSATTVDMGAEFVSVGDEIEVSAPIRARDVANFLMAYGSAACSLRFRSFLKVVESVRRTKRRRAQQGLCLPPDSTHTAALVDRFRRLRTFAFTAEGHCLLHALTLVKFLGCYGCYPDWVIGVAAQPFGAHAWVQWHSYLLDTNPEKVCRYTPILVV